MSVVASALFGRLTRGGFSLLTRFADSSRKQESAPLSAGGRVVLYGASTGNVRDRSRHTTSLGCWFGNVDHIGLLRVVAWLATLGTHPNLATRAPHFLRNTLYSDLGAVWTQRTGGNDATAISVNLLTNVAYFITSPASLIATTGSTVFIVIGPMSANLGPLILLPMVIAQSLRKWQPLDQWATTRNRSSRHCPNWGFMMVVIGATKCGAELS